MSGYSDPLSVHEILAHQEFLRSLSLALGEWSHAADGARGARALRRQPPEAQDEPVVVALAR
jgi:hypothetical protein